MPRHQQSRAQADIFNMRAKTDATPLQSHSQLWKGWYELLINLQRTTATLQHMVWIKADLVWLLKGDDWHAEDLRRTAASHKWKVHTEYLQHHRFGSGSWPLMYVTPLFCPGTLCFVPSNKAAIPKKSQISGWGLLLCDVCYWWIISSSSGVLSLLFSFYQWSVFLNIVRYLALCKKDFTRVSSTCTVAHFDTYGWFTLYWVSNKVYILALKKYLHFD